MQANEMLHTITCLKHLLFKEWFSPGTPASSTTKTGRHDIPKAIQLIGTLQFLQN
jgi:hypothetical protein